MFFSLFNRRWIFFCFAKPHLFFLVSCPYLSQTVFIFSLLFFLFNSHPGWCQGRLGRGWGGKLPVSETGGWKGPWGRAQAGMSCCYPLGNKRHAGVTLFLLMPLCLLGKPVGEELEWKITFLFSPLFISFQCGLCVYVWIHWDACELSGFRNGCSFIQMSCYKTISLAPFCLISFCINPFFWALARGCWSLQRVSLSCAAALSPCFSLCAPSVFFPSHSAFLFEVISFLALGPGSYTCLIFSRATTWPRQCCSSNCCCGPLVFLSGSYTDWFWRPVCFPCYFFFPELWGGNLATERMEWLK